MAGKLSRPSLLFLPMTCCHWNKTECVFMYADDSTTCVHTDSVKGILSFGGVSVFSKRNVLFWQTLAV
jgi:hypothetical protein